MQKNKKNKRRRSSSSRRRKRMNEVKDENFKHSTYIALNLFYMGQYLPWTNDIVI